MENDGSDDDSVEAKSKLAQQTLRESSISGFHPEDLVDLVPVGSPHDE